MSDAIKACPNPECGGIAGQEVRAVEAVVYRWVRCNGCGLNGPHASTPAEAARLWNALPRSPEPGGERAYSHMCRDGHAEVGHNDSEHGCPVCRVEPGGEELREKVDALVEDLFTNGSGAKAERLVLAVDRLRDMGGWCRGAVRDRILAALSQPPTEEPSDIGALRRFRDAFAALFPFNWWGEAREIGFRGDMEQSYFESGERVKELIEAFCATTEERDHEA